jgi:ATP-dependent 26S proteasome regulatory subunit
MLEELQLHIQAGEPLLAIETLDEERATELVRQAVVAQKRTLYEWSVTTGMAQTHPVAMDTNVKPGKPAAALEFILHSTVAGEVFLLKDLGAHTKEPFVQRQLRDIFSQRRATAILVEAGQLPDYVRRLTVLLQLMLPDSDELEALVRDVFRDVKGRSIYEVTSSLTKRELEQLVQTLRGLTRSQAQRVVTSAIIGDNALNADDLPRVVEAKRNLLQTAGCLESINVNVQVDDIGGLDNLKRWLARRRGGMSNRAKEFGLEPPRGILLLGVQGCGKSLCAKIVAEDWKLPLLRMDPGVLYQKFIGESENRLRQALTQAETMAPVVLWIDEIEKAFASASSESADGGLSQRMFGTLLSWMQDHRSPIFMVATANNIAALPPELMRKGRFDEVFFVDLPNLASRQQILSIHLRRRNRDPLKFALDRLGAASDGFSGAEIEQAVNSALYRAFSERADLHDDHILAEIEDTRPLSVLMGDRIRDLRAWAKHRCVPAD